MTGRPGAQKIVCALTILACVIAGVVTCAQFGRSRGPGMVPDTFTMCVLLWDLSPYAGLTGLALWAYRWWRLRSSLVVLAGAMLIGAWGVYAYWWAFGPGIDPQSALMFLFLPLCQWFGCLLAGVPAMSLGVLGRRTG